MHHSARSGQGGRPTSGTSDKQTANRRLCATATALHILPHPAFFYFPVSPHLPHVRTQRLSSLRDLGQTDSAPLVYMLGTWPWPPVFLIRLLLFFGNSSLFLTPCFLFLIYLYLSLFFTVLLSDRPTGRVCAVLPGDRRPCMGPERSEGADRRRITSEDAGHLPNQTHVCQL